MGRDVRLMAHRAGDVADIEQSDLPLVDARERMRDDRVEAGLVDLHAASPTRSRSRKGALEELGGGLEVRELDVFVEPDLWVARLASGASG